MNISFGWQEAGAVVTAVTLVAGAIYAALRNSLKGSFVESHVYETNQAEADETLDGLTGRVTAIETRMERIPTHDDMAKVFERLGRLEVASGATSAALQGVKESMARVEHMVDLLVKFQMKGPTP